MFLQKKINLSKFCLKKSQNEIITHFSGEILRKIDFYNKQANAQNLLVQMTLHFSLEKEESYPIDTKLP